MKINTGIKNNCIACIAVLFGGFGNTNIASAQVKGAEVSVYALKSGRDSKIINPEYYQFKQSIVKAEAGSEINKYLSGNNKPFVDLIESLTGAGFASKFTFAKASQSINTLSVCFTSPGKMIYFSVELQPNGAKKRYFILTAELEGKKWKNITILPFCSNDFSCMQPYVDADGSSMYFSSDKKDSKGGFDIYVSHKTGNIWSQPINLGNSINTDNNELYPFVSNTNTLFFSSNRAGGTGGYDIYKSKRSKGLWQDAIGLVEPVNSKQNDIAFITSDNHDIAYTFQVAAKTNKLISFQKNVPVIEENGCKVPTDKKQYCVEINAKESVDQAAGNLIYIWNFDDGTTLNGIEIEKCFTTSGYHKVTLDIKDPVAKNIRKNEKQLDLDLPEEDGVDFGVPIAFNGEAKVNNNLTFDASGFIPPKIDSSSFKWSFGDLDKSNYKTAGAPKDQYYWDFGDGEAFEQGLSVEHAFKKKGIFWVTLIIWGPDSPKLQHEKNFCFKKQITIR